MDMDQLITYEIVGSWWAGWMPFGQRLISKYMVWKIRRKLARLERFKLLLNVSCEGGSIDGSVSVLDKVP